MTHVLLHCLEKQAGELGDRIAASHRSASITYAELKRQVDHVRMLVADTVPAHTLVFLDVPDKNWCGCLVGYLGIAAAARVAVLSRVAPTQLAAARLTIDTENGYNASVKLPALRSDSFKDAFGVGRTALDVVFTSGSTGQPSPYLFEHGHFFDRSKIVSPKRAMRAIHISIPFYTSTGVHGIALRHLQAGWSSIAVDGPENWNDLAAMLLNTKPYELSATPFELARLVLNDSQTATVDDVRVVRSYAGPLPDHVSAAAQARLPKAQIVSIYGLTEAGAATLIRKGGEQMFASPEGADFRVWDPELNDWSGAGSVGVILAKAPGADIAPIALLAEEEKQTIPRGWVSTGDLGRTDALGSIIMLGRAKEILVVKGERESAPDWERQLLEGLPQAREAMFMNMTDGELETVVVIVAGVSAEHLSAYLLKDGPGSKICCVLVERLARTDLGKLARLENAIATTHAIANSAPILSAQGNNRTVAVYRQLTKSA